MSSNISIDNLAKLSCNISRRDTEENISGAEHYLPDKYLLKDRSGQYGKVGREVLRWEKEGKMSDSEGGEGLRVGSKSPKKDVKYGSGSVKKGRRGRGAGRVKEIVLTLEEGGETDK